MLIKSISTLSSTILYSILMIVAPLSLHILLHNKTLLYDFTLWGGPSPINLSAILDPQGLLFSCIVLFISANVIIFSKSYMAGDPFIARFTHLVLLFVLSINLLIFIPNLITLLLGWDGLGLVSFLLVIYYQNIKSIGAGIITAITNRIGDVFILLTIGWAINMGQWNLLFPLRSNFNPLLSITLILAAITKSAQIPFSRWLPAAIAAPTPVSALVHSSTLVTAGVFLLVRFYPFLSTNNSFNKILLIAATLTTLIAGIRANIECDMKKIIALSTLRQLGVIIVRIGLGAPLLAFFHLLTHALFKALLFLCAGTLINLHSHSQDLRLMGNLPTQLPSITRAIIISNLALCGAPFLAGFYSKDLILEYSTFSRVNITIIIIFFFATGLTVRYTIRFLLVILWGPTNISPCSPVNDHDMRCTAPTIALSTSAILGGATLNWIIISPIPEYFLPPYLKYLTLLVSITGLLLGASISTSLSRIESALVKAPLLNLSSCRMWFLTPLSTQKLLPIPFFIGHQLSKTVDNGWEENIGGQGTLSKSSFIRSIIISIQKNEITSLLFISVLIMPALLIIYLFLSSLILKHNTEDVDMAPCP